MEKRYDCGTHHLPSGEQSRHRLDFPACERLVRLEVEGAIDEFWFNLQYHSVTHGKSGSYGETVPIADLDCVRRIVLIPERYVCEAGSHLILTLGNLDYPGKNFDEPFDLKVTVVAVPAHVCGAAILR